MKRIMLIGVASAASLFGVAAVAAPAMAGNGVTAVTHSAQHPDTTGFAVYTGDEVWAHDNLTEQFTVTPVQLPDGANYQVTINVNGSFTGFADPRTAAQGSPAPGAPLASQGSVKGSITYDVHSDVAPNPANLPAQEPDGTGLSAALQQLMPGSTIVGGGGYNFRYTQVGGTVYTQVG
jgi:hypothetical protein